ncbi:MAG: hypothetical protein FGM61_09805, partial [Sediminibacterium sp.]|nr:hypothetical protein [Sediminibacterium sp.]
MTSPMPQAPDQKADGEKAFPWSTSTRMVDWTFISAPLQHKNINVEVQYDASSPRVEVDFKQIQQVLLNLVQNAIDASPEHSTIHVSTSIVMNDLSEQQNPFVLITVTDEGSGIPKDMWQHLFEPFRTTKASGTGLGLMLTKYI